MMTFHEYLRAMSHGVFAPPRPFLPKRPSTEVPMPSCRERARRLTRKFKPRFVQDTPVAAHQPQRRQPFTWSTVS